MTTIFANKALLASGWAQAVRLTIDGDTIVRAERDGEARSDDLRAGIVIPGIANAHSHAFQRALAGHTEHRGPNNEDDFWTWRTRMYQLAGQIDADRLQAIARQAYAEMLCSGYTAVAEFHYLHSEPNDASNSTRMFEALAHAATDTGIRLSYIPVLYQRAGFDIPEPTKDQARFAKSTEDFVAHYEAAKKFAGESVVVGIGVHSLRAAEEFAVNEVATIAGRDKCPMHIHIAEQTGEVDQCMDAHGMRPVEWLYDRYEPDRNWCLVHATHIDERETRTIADSGAVVCLCPSTEGNLGDGIFPLKSYLAFGGRIAIGSDSHISINPFEELRWLEYGQRLINRTRNVAAIGSRHTGRSLYEMAREGGAAACGFADAGLQKGAAADLLVLDDDNPMLAGHDSESILDALVFSGYSLPVDRVMVAGKWRVVNGRHESAEQAADDYRQVVRALQAEAGQ